MEHSVSSLDLAHPWRRATLVAGTLAAVELVLIAVLAGALMGRPMAEKLEQRAVASVPVAPTPAKAAPPTRKGAQDARAVLPRPDTAVLVLNGNGRSGAAGDAAAQLKDRGYVLAGVANAPRSDYRRTLVMFRPGHLPEAQRLAKDIGAGVVAPLDGIAARDLMGAHVAVVLGP